MRKTKIALALTLSLFASVGLAKGKNPGPDSIVDIATGAEYGSVFTTLVGLVAKAGLVETLSVDGQFTVFAPINAAFEPLGGSADAVEATLEGICTTDDATPAIENVLLHHVRDGRRNSGSLLGGKGPKSVEMLNGYIMVNDDGSIIDGVGGNAADIQIEAELYDISASNGVIHVIDAVLLPQDLCAGTTPTV